GPANNLVPIEAQTGLNQQSLCDVPTVLKIGAGGGIVKHEGRDRHESALAQQGSIFPQVAHGISSQIFVVANAIGLNAGLRAVLAVPADCVQIKSGVGFGTLRPAGEVFEIAALREFRSDFVGRVSVGLVIIAEPHIGNSEVEEGSTTESELFAEIGEPRDDVALCGADLRDER